MAPTHSQSTYTAQCWRHCRNTRASASQPRQKQRQALKRMTGPAKRHDVKAWLESRYSER